MTIRTPTQRTSASSGEETQLVRNTRSKVALWIARVGGLALVVWHWNDGVYEVNRLIVQKWAYAERIFSVAFLAMMLGALVGWRSGRAGAALMLSGYILAASLPFMGGFTRPELASSPGEMAVALLPFFVLGALYGYSERRTVLA